MLKSKALIISANIKYERIIINVNKYDCLYDCLLLSVENAGKKTATTKANIQF